MKCLLRLRNGHRTVFQNGFQSSDLNSLGDTYLEAGASSPTPPDFSNVDHCYWMFIGYSLIFRRKLAQ